MTREQVELRAAKLGVTLFMFGEVHAPFPDMYADVAPRMSAEAHALFATTGRDDLALSNACLEVEYDLRRREWDALTVLLGAIPPGGDVSSIYDLPAEQSIVALRAADGCGWLRAGRA